MTTTGMTTTTVATMAMALGVTVLLALATWVASLARTDVSLVDRVWGILIAAAATACLLPLLPAGTGTDLRALVMLVLVWIWALRLSAYVSWRNWGHGEDRRYQEIRARNQPNFAWKSIYLVFLLQAVLAWLVAAPFLAAARGATLAGVSLTPSTVSEVVAGSSVVPGAAVAAGPALVAGSGVASASAAAATSAVTSTPWSTLGTLDLLGIAIAAFGIACEAVADQQMAAFKADAANQGRVMDRGLWRFSRHPNYFGECCLWWGFWLMAIGAAGIGGAWWSVVSPVVMTVLLLKVSGVSLLERDIAERRPAYRDYVARTNAFIPGWPRRSKDRV